MEDLVLTTGQIVERLNKGDYEDIGEFLQAIDWTQIAPKTIIPKSTLRKFVRSISNKDVRVAVMEFLSKFAHDFFFDGAVDMEYKQIKEDNEGLEEDEITDYAREDAAEDIRNFKAELNFQIDLVKSKEAPGAIIDRLKKQKDILEKEIKELKEDKLKLHKEIATLRSRIDELEHPERRHQIPNELRCEEFYHIISYLQKSGYVSPRESPVGMYRGPIYYHWNIPSPKALFGYFVCKTCYLLELRTKEDHLMWKLFKQAFDNFDTFEKQARDQASKNKNWINAISSDKPEGAHIIDDAFAYCATQMELSKKTKGAIGHK